VKTCLKWESAQMQAYVLHRELEAMSLKNDEDMSQYQQKLANYANYMRYVALMRGQLEQLMPGAGDDDFGAVLDQYYSKSFSQEELKNQVHQEFDREIMPELDLLKQYQGTVDPLQAQNMCRAV
jgi:hypothetical protein